MSGLSLGVLIGATLAPQFTSTLNSVKSNLLGIGSTVKKLSGQKANILSFEKAKADALEMGKSCQALKNKMAELQKQIKDVANSDPKLAGKLCKELSETSAKLDQTKGKLKEKMRAVRESQAAMEKAGTTVGNYKRKLSTLSSELEKARARQARFNDLVGRRQAAKDNLSAASGKFIGNVAKTAAVVYPIKASIERANEFDYDMQMIGNTANMTRAEIASLGRDIISASDKTGQAYKDIQASVGELIAAGQDVETVKKSIEIYGKAATATGSDILDLSKTGFQLISTLNFTPDTLTKGLDILAQTGKAGNFELKDMAKHIPSLAPRLKALGMQGKEAAAEMGAMLQIAKKGAGTVDEAANNTENFFDKVLSPTALKKASKNFGLDLHGIYQKARQEGKSAFEPLMEAIMKATKGGDVKLLGDMFQDKQVLSFLRPMMQNWEEYKKIKAEALGASGVIDEDAAKVSEQAAHTWKVFGNAWDSLKLTFGSTMKEELSGVLKELTPLITRFRDFIKENPKLVRNIAFAVVGFSGLLTAASGVGLVLSGLNFAGLSALTGFSWVGQIFPAVASGATKLGGVVGRLGGMFRGLGRAALSAGRFLAVGVGRGVALAGRSFLALGRGALSVGRFLASGIGRGAMMAGRFALSLGRGVLMLGRVLGGQLVRGVMMAGRAILFLGRAALMNPIGLLITAIAVAAFLIWKYWDKIVPFFKELWESVKNIFSAVWEGIKNVVGKAWEWIKDIFFSYHPLGIIIANWDAIKGYFSGLWESVKGVFSTLWDDIKNVIGQAWEWIKNLFFTFHPVGIIIANWEAIVSTGKDILNRLGNAVSAGMEAVKNWFRMGADFIVSTIQELPGKMLSLGGQIIDGLIGGIRSKWESLKATLTGTVQTASNTTQKTAQIKSPSRLFARHGQRFVEGLSVGVSERKEGLLTNMANLSAQTAAAWRPGELAAPKIGRLKSNDGETAGIGRMLSRAASTLLPPILMSAALPALSVERSPNVQFDALPQLTAAPFDLLKAEPFETLKAAPFDLLRTAPLPGLQVDPIAPLTFDQAPALAVGTLPNLGVEALPKLRVDPLPTLRTGPLPQLTTAPFDLLKAEPFAPLKAAPFDLLRAETLPWLQAEPIAPLSFAQAPAFTAGSLPDLRAEALPKLTADSLPTLQVDPLPSLSATPFDLLKAEPFEALKAAPFEPLRLGSTPGFVASNQPDQRDSLSRTMGLVGKLVPEVAPITRILSRRFETTQATKKAGEHRESRTFERFAASMPARSSVSSTTLAQPASPALTPIASNMTAPRDDLSRTMRLVGKLIPDAAPIARALSRYFETPKAPPASRFPRPDVSTETSAAALPESLKTLRNWNVKPDERGEGSSFIGNRLIAELSPRPEPKQSADPAVERVRSIVTPRQASSTATPARQDRSQGNVTQNITINIAQQPGEDAERLAEKIARKLEEKAALTRRAGLGDWG